ncbi:MAG: hypothetical protein ACTHKL_01045 [Streptosporangiaceae bacterium]
MAVGGCAGHTGGQRSVLQKAGNQFRVQGSVSIDALTDVGVPLLTNLTSSKVRLLSVRLVGLKRAVHIIGVQAYSSRGIGFDQIFFERGSLPAECPKYFKHPRAVTAVTVGPKQHVKWIVTVVIRISKPGRYHFDRARIAYSIDGVRGWQYQNLNLTLYSEPPPDRRLRIDPESSVCG